MADATDVIAIGTGEPVADPTALSVDEVADMLEQVAAANVEIAVQRLDELLSQLRPATYLRHTLSQVPASTMREAVALLARMQEQR